MKFYEPISQDSIFDEINRICNTTNLTYLPKHKIARINDAIDKYWFLAAESAPQGTLDDTSNSSAPIETQNLVSGTNAYKVSSFTDKVLQILRVSVLDSNGNEYDLCYQDFEDIEDFTQEYSTTLNAGLPQYWTKLGDYIYVSPAPNYNYTAGLRCYVNRRLSQLSYVTFTTTIATPGVATATAHGLVDGDAVLLFTDGALPTGLTAEQTVYYIDQQTADTWKWCSTPGNVGSTFITTSGSQSGTHKFVKVSGEPGIPVIHHTYLARCASYAFMKPDHPNFAKVREDMAIDRQNIQDYWQSVVRPGKTIIETKRRAFK